MQLLGDYPPLMLLLKELEADLLYLEAPAGKPTPPAP